MMYKVADKYKRCRIKKHAQNKISFYDENDISRLVARKIARGTIEKLYLCKYYRKIDHKFLTLLHFYRQAYRDAYNYKPPKEKEIPIII